MKIEGTMFTLEKCSPQGRSCTLESEDGVKTTGFIVPQTWNILTVLLDHQMVN